MEVFNNCRICLQCINHEPIKMTRSILKFIKDGLKMESIVRQLEPTNAKQNLCAACFNKLAELQDFLEQCREADDFWKNQFPREEDKLNNLKEQQPQEQIKVDEDKHISVSDVSSTKPSEMHLEQYQDTKHEEEEDDELLLSLAVPDDVGQTSQHIVIEETGGESEIQIHDFDTPEQADDNWPDDEESVIDLESGSSVPETYVADQEIIQYEYELPQESSDRNEFLTDSRQLTITDEEEPCQAENQSFAYEGDEGDDDSCTLLQESFDDVLSNGNTIEESPEATASPNTYVVNTLLDENGKMKKSYQCLHCDRSFDRIYDIESHYNIHSDIKPFKCNVCNKSFRQKNILTTHQALHFGKKVECPECGKKFARRSQLILHFRMHRDEKPFVCEFEDCQAAFRQRQHLVDHTFIHTGEKNFQCSTCTKSFQTRKRLQDHMYKVHSYHRYVCDRCDKAFLKPHMLKNHLSSAHKVGVQDVSHLKTTIDQIKTLKK